MGDECASRQLDPNQKAVVMIMDVFTAGQMTSEVLDLLEDSNILVTNVPPNTTKFYQPLDLTVNTVISSLGHMVIGLKQVRVPIGT